MQFTNQYLNLEKHEISRTTIEIDKKRVALLRGFQPRSGVLQTTLSILLEKLCHELEQSKLTTGDWSEYESAIANATITLGTGAEGANQRGGAVEKSTARSKSSRARKTAG